MYRVIQPVPALRPFVRSFWIFEGNEGALPYIYRSMADGCAEILFHYRGQFTEITDNGPAPSYTAGFHAQSKLFRRFATHEAFGIFGAYLYPFALRIICGCPATELSDQMPDLETALDREGHELTEQMMTAVDNAERLSIFTAFLLRKLAPANNRKTDPMELAVRKIVKTKEMFSVSVMAAEYCLSLRQFERKFREYAGFSPKLYMRINRFQAATDWYSCGKDTSLTEIGYRCGYYDQSHFIHEFRQFSGYHPGQFFSKSAEGTDWRGG